ncbi:phage tail tube protein [Roseomonas chloroacetimidivorans]|uniref:phage tail tube protein n=1 Tax=Roseomonas chloroacetimidivorans TaxID=1766656 RepID=UPI003C77C8F2
MAIFNGGATSGGRRAGVASATIDGEAIDMSDLVYDVTAVTRENLTGQNGVHGYSEMPKTPQMAFTVRDAQNMSVSAFMAMTSVSIVAVLASGKTVSGDGMWCTECSEVNTTAGTFSVRFSGFSVEEY